MLAQGTKENVLWLDPKSVEQIGCGGGLPPHILLGAESRKRAGHPSKQGQDFADQGTQDDHGHWSIPLGIGILP